MAQAKHTPSLLVDHTADSLSAVQMLPNVRHSWLIQEISEEILTEARAAGITQVCPRTNALTVSHAAQVRSAGFSLRAWGVRSTQVRFRSSNATSHILI